MASKIEMSGFFSPWSPP